MKKGLLSLGFLLLTLCFPLSALADESSNTDAWTVLVYMCGSDLESKYSFGTANLEEIATVKAPKSVLTDDLYIVADLQDMINEKTGKVNVLIETGGAKAWHAEELGMQIRTDALQYWQYHSSEDEEKGSFTLENEKPLASMAEPDTLADFIRWGTEYYPAEKYALVLWNHGGGSATGILIDELYDGRYMTLDLLKQALHDGGIHFEAVIFDACLMANIETACAIREDADWMIASEELVAGKGTAFGEWLQELYYVPQADGRLLGRWICDTAMIKYANDDDEQAQNLLTWSVINLSKVERLEKNFDKVFEVMSVFYTQYPELLVQFSNAAHFYEEFGTGSENMYDLSGFLYDSVLRNSASAAMQMGMQESLAEAVDYCVRGAGRPAARGLSFCFATDFMSDELDTYARNCPSPHYLALLDAISPWQAPDWVFEKADRIPEQADDSNYHIQIEKKIWENGSPALVVTAGEMNIGMMKYTLYKKDERTGETIKLGKVPVWYDSEAELYHIYNLLSWPAIEGNLCQIELQNMVGKGNHNLLYNIPVMVDSVMMNMRCAYWFNKEEFEILGLWEDYDSDSTQFNRNVKSLSQVAGQEFSLQYEVLNSQENTSVSYLSSPAMTLYRAMKVQEATLPPGTYYLQFAVVDPFMREIPMDMVELSLDGQEISIQNGSWEGSITLNAKDYYFN